MAIDKRFVHFQTREAFNTANNAGDILNESIVFIADEQRIWTHGKFYNPASFSKVIAGDKEISAKDINAAITFLAGGGLSISADDSGNITYAHKGKDAGLANVTEQAGKFISAITFDEFGHVVSVETADVAQNTYSTVIANAADATASAGTALANGGVYINTVETDAISGDKDAVSSILVKGKDDVEVTALADGTIEVGHKLGTGSTMTATAAGEPTSDSVNVIQNVVADGFGHLISLGSIPVPTKKYVDGLLSDMGAAIDGSLIFRGVLGTGEGMVSLPTADCEVGDVYKVGTAGTYANQVCQVGDVVICVKETPEWVVLQTNTDVANDQFLGLVKGGYTSSEAARNFAVEIAADGTMYVNVPFEYASSSESILSNSADGKESVTTIANGDVRINHLETTKDAAGVETTTVKSSINVKGTGATTVTALDGAIVVDSHDTKYSMTVTETAANKKINLLQDGVLLSEFTIDAWHEGN